MDQNILEKKIFDEKMSKNLFLSTFNKKCTKSTEPAELTNARTANDSSKFCNEVL